MVKLLDNSSFWVTKRHTFTDYGRGVRYLRWRDGARDAAHFSHQTGGLLDGGQVATATRPHTRLPALG